MKPLNIALIRQRYTAFGGAERFVSRAMQALQREGAQLTLVTRHWEGGSGFQPLICDPIYFGSLWRDWSFARCACRALGQRHFDLVQSHERVACCDIYRAGDGVHREWLEQRRRVLGPWGKIGVALNPYHHYVLAAEEKLFASPRLKAVICNSRMVKEEIRHHFGVPEAKLRVIYSGVDTEIFHPGLRQRHRAAFRAQHGIPEEATLFLFVGSGFARKGLGTALEAMARLPASAYLWVVGKDKRLASFRAQAQKLGLAGRVHLAGGQADVRPFYGAADALVLPTLYDPFPNAALEAMACGLPVVTSEKCGAAELIQSGKNGFVCDALDVGGLAAFMERLMLREQAQALGENARAVVAAMSLERMGGELLALYQSLLV